MSDQGPISDGSEGYEGAENGYADQNGYAEQDGYAGAYEPAPGWLAPIEARMDELREQNEALAQAFYEEQVAEYGDVGGLTAEELAEPEAARWAHGDEEDDGQNGQIDIFDLINASLDQRLEQQALAEGKEDRDEAFEDLREGYAILQDPEACYAIIQRAAAIAQATIDPSFVNTPQFVDLIEIVARTAMLEQAEHGAFQTSEPIAPNGVVLESAAGAIPSAPRRDVSEVIGERIIAAAERAHPRI